MNYSLKEQYKMFIWERQVAYSLVRDLKINELITVMIYHKCIQEVIAYHTICI